MASLALGAPAQAHEREPEFVDLAFDPDDPAIVVAASSVGLWTSTDDGRSWDWICPALYGADGERRENDDPAIVVAGGALVLGSEFVGLRRSEALGCAWTTPEAELAGVVPTVSRGPDGTLLSADTTGTVGEDRIWASADDGRTWTTQGAAFDRRAVDSFAWAPGAPGVVYAAMNAGPDGEQTLRAELWRSDDGGATWSQTTTIAYAAAEDGVRLHRVDPTDVDVVWLSTEVREGEIVAPERLLRVRGATADVVLELARINDVELSADGASVWVGGEHRAGLWRSDDGGESFAQVQSGLDVSCVRRRPRDGSLWLCGKPVRDTFGIARSDDAGETLTPVFTTASVRRRDPCAPSVSAQCDLQWFDLVEDLALDPALVTPPPRDGALDGDDASDVGGADVGTGDALDSDDGSGCGCAVRTRGAGDGGWATLLGALAAWAWLRRRSRASAG